ncbi:hypothetical protein [Neobacillus cucumis]
MNLSYPNKWLSLQPEKLFVTGILFALKRGIKDDRSCWCHHGK